MQPYSVIVSSQEIHDRIEAIFEAEGVPCWPVKVTTIIQDLIDLYKVEDVSALSDMVIDHLECHPVENLDMVDILIERFIHLVDPVTIYGHDLPGYTAQITMDSASECFLVEFVKEPPKLIANYMDDLSAMIKESVENGDYIPESTVRLLSMIR